MAIVYFDDVVKNLGFEQIAQIPRDVKANILRAEAAPIVEAQRQMARATFSTTTGKTAESAFAEEPVVTNAGGYIITSFQGERKRNKPVRNAEIAYLNHYGVKGRNRETRFIDRANEKSADASAEAGAEVLFQWQQRQLQR